MHNINIELSFFGIPVPGIIRPLGRRNGRRMLEHIEQAVATYFFFASCTLSMNLVEQIIP